jgi:cell shape-determining protein MreC
MAGTDSMTRQQQRIEELERENERLKNELLVASVIDFEG